MCGIAGIIYRDGAHPIGRDMTRMIPDATWLPIAGMGHDMPIPLWPTIVRAIARLAERADAAVR